MGKYLKPLFVFGAGQLVLLFALLFMPAIGQAGDELATNSANWATVGWGWTWVVGSTRLLIFIFAELVILYATAKAFLAGHN